MPQNVNVVWQYTNLSQLIFNLPFYDLQNSGGTIIY